MIEIKFSQKAKPGKGGLLPKEKITKEIAEIRHVPMGEDVVSPERHVECDTAENTVKFIKRIQDITQLPVGIKFCLGDENEFRSLVQVMKRHDIFPDCMVVDGAEGGTGAAPKSFMDNVGMPLPVGLTCVNNILIEESVRNKLKIIASGKLINAGKQITALSQGADAIYSARGFMLTLGCIQALTCNNNTCPVGITTHDWSLQRGIDVNSKAKRIATNYVKNLEHEFEALLAATGTRKSQDLTKKNIYIPDEKNI